MQSQVPLPALATPLGDALRTRLGLQLDKTEATVDPAGFAATHAAAESLALATLVTGETLAALRTLGEVLAELQAGAADLGDLVKVVRQIDRLLGASPGKPPSAYSLAKLLLIVSGDADEADNRPPARRLVYLLKGENPDGNALSDAAVAEPQAIVALALMAVGTVIDRGFGGDDADAGMPAAALAAAIPLPAAQLTREFELAKSADAARKLVLQLGWDGAAAPPKLHARLRSTL
ncbi:hypothetical protein, partial [Rubrivivax gelatinosus]